MKNPSGIFAVNKQRGKVTNEIMNYFRGFFNSKFQKKIKVGHGGALDPEVSGVLVIAYGSYTKKLTDFTHKIKDYSVEIILDHDENNNMIYYESNIVLLCQNIQNFIMQLKGGELQYLCKNTKDKFKKCFIRDIEISLFQYPFITFNISSTGSFNIQKVFEVIFPERSFIIKNAIRTRLGDYYLNNVITTQDDLINVIFKKNTTLKRKDNIEQFGRSNKRLKTSHF